MLQKKHWQGISITLLLAFLFSCSTENGGQTDNAEQAKALKAKIVYFSIPG